MTDRYKTLIIALTMGAVFLVAGNRSWSSDTVTVQAAGSQNLAFIDEAGEQAFENFSKVATLHGTLFQGIDKAKVFSKREHKVWDVESNLYLAGEGLHVFTVHVDEIPPGEHNVKHRGPSESIKYVISGRGYMLFQALGEQEQRLEFEAGDLITIPGYAWHYSFKTDPDHPLRFLAVTAKALTVNLGIRRPPDPENDQYAIEARERLMTQ